jgi:hypothetical protein
MFISPFLYCKGIIPHKKAARVACRATNGTVESTQKHDLRQPRGHAGAHFDNDVPFVLPNHPPWYIIYPSNQGGWTDDS